MTAAIVVFIVAATAINRWINPPGPVELGAIGESFVVPVNRSDGEVRVRVTELREVSESDAEEWKLRQGAEKYYVHYDLPNDPTFYFVYYSIEPVSGEFPAQPTSNWVLATADEALYPSHFISTPDEADCPAPQVDNQGEACTVVLVPRGAEIVTVRYYGVDVWSNRAGMGNKDWAGWTLE